MARGSSFVFSRLDIQDSQLRFFLINYNILLYSYGRAQEDNGPGMPCSSTMGLPVNNLWDFGRVLLGKIHRLQLLPTHNHNYIHIDIINKEIVERTDKNWGFSH